MVRQLKILWQFATIRSFNSHKKLKKYKEKKLKNILRNHKSKFYAISDVLEDFQVIDKTIFMNNFNIINSCGLKYDEAIQIALDAERSRDFRKKSVNTTVGLSSGTSGNRGVFLVNDDESIKWAAYILRKMLPKPWLRRHRIAFFLRANSNLYESVNSLFIKFKYFDLTTDLASHINELVKFNPTVLIAPAKVLELLAQNDSLEISPQKIISVADVLEPEIELRIEKRFNQKVHQIYQATEGLIACTCEFGHLHLNEDILHIEKDWLDDTKQRFCPIITDYNRFTQPLIRYRLNDILHIDNEPCKCHSLFQKIARIEGRTDDILVLKNLEDNDFKLFPDFIRRVFLRVECVQEYQVINENEVMHVYLYPIECKDLVLKELHNLLDEFLLQKVDFRFHRYKAPSLSEKFRRVIQK